MADITGGPGSGFGGGAPGTPIPGRPGFLFGPGGNPITSAQWAYDQSSGLGGQGAGGGDITGGASGNNGVGQPIGSPSGGSPAAPVGSPAPNASPSPAAPQFTGSMATLLGGLGASPAATAGLPAPANSVGNIGPWAGVEVGQNAAHPWVLPTNLLSNPQAQEAAFPNGSPTTITQGGWPYYATFDYTHLPNGQFQFNGVKYIAKQKPNDIWGTVGDIAGGVLGALAAPFTFGTSLLGIAGLGTALASGIGSGIGGFLGNEAAGEPLGKSLTSGLEDLGIGTASSFGLNYLSSALGIPSPTQYVENLLGIGGGGGGAVPTVTPGSPSGDLVAALTGGQAIPGIQVPITSADVSSALSGGLQDLGATAANEAQALFGGPDAGLPAGAQLPANVNSIITGAAPNDYVSSLIGASGPGVAAAAPVSNIAYNAAPSAPTPQQFAASEANMLLGGPGQGLPAGAQLPENVALGSGNTGLGDFGGLGTPSLQTPNAATIAAAEAGSAMPGSTMAASSPAMNLTDQLMAGQPTSIPGASTVLPAANPNVAISPSGGLVNDLISGNFGSAAGDVGSLVGNNWKSLLPLGVLGYEMLGGKGLGGGQNLTSEYPQLAGPLIQGAQQETAQQGALNAQGQQLIQGLISGQLPPGLQALMNQSENSAVQTIRSRFAGMGLGNSTMETQEEAMVPVQAQIEQAQIAQQMAQLGLQEIGQGTQTGGLSDQIYQSLLNSQIAQDNQLSASIANLAAAAGGMGTSGMLSKLVAAA